METQEIVETLNNCKNIFFYYNDSEQLINEICNSNSNKLLISIIKNLYLVKDLRSINQVKFVLIKRNNIPLIILVNNNSLNDDVSAVLEIYDLIIQLKEYPLSLNITNWLSYILNYLTLNFYRIIQYLTIPKF